MDQSHQAHNLNMAGVLYEVNTKKKFNKEFIYLRVWSILSNRSDGYRAGKKCHFGPQVFSEGVLSNSPCPCVCQCVVFKNLRDPSLLFSENLYDFGGQ